MLDPLPQAFQVALLGNTAMNERGREGLQWPIPLQFQKKKNHFAFGDFQSHHGLELISICFTCVAAFEFQNHAYRYAKCNFPKLLFLLTECVLCFFFQLIFSWFSQVPFFSFWFIGGSSVNFFNKNPSFGLGGFWVLCIWEIPWQVCAFFYVVEALFGWFVGLVMETGVIFVEKLWRSCQKEGVIWSILLIFMVLEDEDLCVKVKSWIRIIWVDVVVFPWLFYYWKLWKHQNFLLLQWTLTVWPACTIFIMVGLYQLLHLICFSVSLITLFVILYFFFVSVCFVQKLYLLFTLACHWNAYVLRVFSCWSVFLPEHMHVVLIFLTNVVYFNH